MKKILVLHGPNLNLLGEREPGIYGSLSLKGINNLLEEEAAQLDVTLTCEQSNSEGELIDALHRAQIGQNGVVFNPAGYTHTSVALRDAIAAIQIPVVEVHLSNIHSRESFRHTSLTAGACAGMLCGFGWKSYLYGLHAIVELLEERIV
ncbi:MAG: type II 3-dehydroquinate dehydratase [Anaerolineales bacterium]|nr:type II 3-dehydroquinate dehydratase [Anaerolineales bacterium]